MYSYICSWFWDVEEEQKEQKENDINIDIDKRISIFIQNKNFIKALNKIIENQMWYIQNKKHTDVHLKEGIADIRKAVSLEGSDE